MFERNEENEQGIAKSYYKNKTLNLKLLVKIIRAKGQVAKHPHLDRKRRHCYPRGEAWLQIEAVDDMGFYT